MIDPLAVIPHVGVGSTNARKKCKDKLSLKNRFFRMTYDAVSVRLFQTKSTNYDMTMTKINFCFFR